MSNNRNVRIKTRITRALVATSLASVVVGVIGVAALYHFMRDVERLYQEGANITEFDAVSESDFFIPLVLICAVLVVCVIASVIFARNNTRAIMVPLEKIMKTVEQVGETGDIYFTEDFKQSVRDDGKYKDEMGRLSCGFAKMMDDILEKVAVLDIAASGDLTQRAASASEKDTLANATNQLIGNLHDITSSVRESLDQFNVGIVQISQGAQALAQSTMEQSVTMEQLSSSVSEVSNQASDNAKHSMEASNITTAIWKSAEEGRDSMDKMMEAMDEINTASQSISTVMKAIDDIAFQTNILSLNAAVEAARAGQNGRGFAVVADEVRNLATRSAEAAKNSSELIEDTISKSGMGTEIVKSTSDYLNRIMDGISENTSILKSIARASCDQNDSIDNINKGFQELSNVVHLNSATAEQSAAATEQMSSQTDALLALISVFKTGKNDRQETEGFGSIANADDSAGTAVFSEPLLVNQEQGDEREKEAQHGQNLNATVQNDTGAGNISVSAATPFGEDEKLTEPKNSPGTWKDDISKY